MNNSQARRESLSTKDIVFVLVIIFQIIALVLIGGDAESEQGCWTVAGAILMIANAAICVGYVIDADKAEGDLASTLRHTPLI